MILPSLNHTLQREQEQQPHGQPVFHRGLPFDCAATSTASCCSYRISRAVTCFIIVSSLPRRVITVRVAG